MATDTDVNASAVETVMVIATSVKSLSDIFKIEPFNGTHFKR